jgi:hypothetical protein
VRKIWKWLLLILLPVMALAQTATTDSAMGELLKKAWTNYAYSENQPDKLVCLYGLPIVHGDTTQGSTFRQFHIDSMALQETCDVKDPGMLGAFFLLPHSVADYVNQDQAISTACDLLSGKARRFRVIGYVHGIGPKADSLGKWHRSALVWSCWR